MHASTYRRKLIKSNFRSVLVALLSVVGAPSLRKLHDGTLSAPITPRYHTGTDCVCARALLTGCQRRQQLASAGFAAPAAAQRPHQTQRARAGAQRRRRLAQVVAGNQCWCENSGLPMMALAARAFQSNASRPNKPSARSRRHRRSGQVWLARLVGCLFTTCGAATTLTSSCTSRKKTCGWCRNWPSTKWL